MVDRLKTPAAWPTILLERAGAADPTDLDGAVKAGAFVGLTKAVRDLGPTATIAAVAASGLRGRGGAGYLAAEKWRTAAASDAPRRYVVANGYGADPATGTDRYLLEHDPFAVVEGVAIAAFAIGATEAIIAVRPRTPSPSAGFRRRSARPPTRAISGRTRSARGPISPSPSDRSRAPTCWARRPCC